MVKTLFVQPAHTYIPPEGEGHIYTPSSLWAAGAKLIEAGADIAFADENLRPVDTQHADVLGINLVGPPYIPLVRRRFQSVLDGEQQCIIGGQVVTGLSRNQFIQLFGAKAIHGSYYSLVANMVGANFENMKDDEHTSLISAYQRIPDEDMRKYLDPEREISFYLGQGCVFDCMFCGAEKKRNETYRDPTIIEKDLTYLTERALKFDIHQLSMYLSNLDVFQNIEPLKEFASIVNILKRKNPGFSYHMRGLATATMLRNAVRDAPKVVQSLRDAGFHTVGIGVDGGDERIWRSVKKGHNNEHVILESMEGAKAYGITPEAIMVFGHPEETRESLENAVHLTEQLQETFNAVPRPHVAKDLIPGNDYWKNEIENATAEERNDRAKRIQFLLEQPRYFQALDFKALASSVTHSNEILRHMVNEYYRRITNMCQNEFDRNALIYPIAPEFSEEINALHEYWNRGKYDR